ncbi:MAG: hypothetical protein JO010_05295, partial [Alphaproteobacteria bacterium]|nr:hypothetical protein [Alphaproteobacteria bacterium]
MPATPRDEPWRRLLWALPAASLIALLSLMGFLRLLLPPPDRPQAVRPLEIGMVELPKEAAAPLPAAESAAEARPPQETPPLPEEPSANPTPPPEPIAALPVEPVPPRPQKRPTAPPPRRQPRPSAAPDRP